MEEIKQFRDRSFNLYGLRSCVQIKLFKSKEGEPILMLEAANALPQAGANAKYDWNNKIKFSIGEPDILTLLNGVRCGFNPEKNKNSKGEPKQFQLYHDPGKGSASEGQTSKSLTITKGANYGFMLNINQKVKVETEGNKNISVGIGVSDAQMIGLRLVLEKSFLYITGLEDF